MNNFDYTRAVTLKDAIQRSDVASTHYIAGGTELLNWMRLGITQPSHLVDIGFLGGYRDIKREGNELLIGALATLNEVGANDLVRQHATALGQACLKAASAQIRNRATIGGNVLQKTRCVYFRSEAPLPWGCNKRVPGSGCAAREGLNERHAILGWTDACVAVHPSDPLVALACLDARVDLTGPEGPRVLDVRSLHLTQEEARAERSPAHEAQRESRLRPREIIVGYRLPLAASQGSAYVKVRERESFEYALVSAAASLQLNSGTIQQARIALGSVAQRPWRLTAAEQALIGREPNKEVVLRAIRDALSDAKPLQHNGYKVTMAANAATRAVLAAGGVA